MHFLAVGASEGRQPFAPTELIAANGFDYVYYLRTIRTSRRRGVDPFWHFQTDRLEGRPQSERAFRHRGLSWRPTPTWRPRGINPLDHYNNFGWHEGRDPSLDFDTTSYLAANPDVAAAHVNPLVHYFEFGFAEGRQTFADGVWG